MARVVLRRIKEIREKEPERQIVYTDETWLNSGHQVKKEWIDLKALENPCRSIHDYTEPLGVQKIQLAEESDL